MERGTNQLAAHTRESRLDRQWEARARSLGYSGTAGLLSATQALSTRELAELLQVTAGQIMRVRKLRGQPASFTPEELAQVPAGSQPAQDGHLLCLECGEYARGLAIHVGLTHAMTEYEYQVRHGLPTETRLRDLHRDSTRCPDPAAARADLRALLAARPAGVPDEPPEDPRALTVRNMERRWKTVTDSLGYSGTGEFLRLTRALSVHEVARYLGVTPAQVASVRRVCDCPAPVPLPELARIPAGRQPAKRGHLLCLECGQFFRTLPRHLETFHGIAPATYRSKHSLGPETALKNLGPDDEESVLPSHLAADPERLSRAHAIAEEDLLDRLAAREPASPTAAPCGPPGFDVLLNVLGTHEGRALAYLAMRPETSYGQEALQRRFLDIQGPEPAVAGPPDRLRGYCAQYFGPAGLTRRARDSDGALRYTRSENTAATALAGYLLAAAEAHPAGLTRIFGRGPGAGHKDPSPAHVPTQRLALLRLLAARGGRATPTEAAGSLRIRQNHARTMMESFAEAGLLDYHLAPGHATGTCYRITAPLPDRGDSRTGAASLIAAYINERLAGHPGPDALEIPLKDLEAHLRSFPYWRDRLVVPARSIMAAAVRRGELPPPARLPRDRTTSMTGAQRSFVSRLTGGIDRIEAGDPAALRDGAEQARAIIANPSRVRALLAKAYAKRSRD